jgi:threonine synthase
MDELECLFCCKSFPLDIHGPFCPDCGEPMIVHYPPKKRRLRKSGATIYDRYADFLPLKGFDRRFSLGEGGTPLRRMDRLMAEFGLPNVLAKNEMMNPTASFKDRGSVIAVQKAVELGFRRLGTISTGNMAGSTAAYAAKAGLTSLIFVKEDTTREKIAAAAIYGPAVIKVRGDYAGLFRKSFEIGRAHGIAFMNSVDPFRIEGYKITGYEIYESLGPAAFAPRTRVHIVVPVSAGGHFIGLIRAFLDLREAGLIQAVPRFIGVQAMGCSPIARAFDRSASHIRRFPVPRTIAHAISNPFPPGGNLVLHLLEKMGGIMTAVSEDEILRAQSLLASREGLFCDPAAATALAAVLRLQRRKALDAESLNVLILTGSGLKTIEDLDPATLDIRACDLDDLDTAI